MIPTLGVRQFLRARLAGVRDRQGRAEYRPHGESGPTDLYLDLMKRSLTNSIYGAGDDYLSDPVTREKGPGWPRNAHTMIGLKRLDNIQFCVEDVLARNVPGDLIETGVWRG